MDSGPALVYSHGMTFGGGMSRVFGRNLQALREQAGYSLVDLAQVIGYHASYLSHIERGRRLPPKYSVIMEMADALFASRDQKLQLWDAAIWTVAASGIEHLGGNGDQQFEAFIQRMSQPNNLRAVSLGVFPIEPGLAPAGITDPKS